MRWTQMERENQINDKKAELISLFTQRDEIELDIYALETELEELENESL